MLAGATLLRWTLACALGEGPSVYAPFRLVCCIGSVLFNGLMTLNLISTVVT